MKVHKMCDEKGDEVMNRKDVIKQILSKLRETREIIKKSTDRSCDDMKEAESAMKSRYSSAREESEYLFQSLQKKLEETDKVITQLELFTRTIQDKPTLKIDVGSIVFLYEDGRKKEEIYIILPNGGGTSISTDIGEITVITPISPIGKQLIGLSAGKICNIQERKMEIISLY